VPTPHKGKQEVPLVRFALYDKRIWTDLTVTVLFVIFEVWK
jgi:hypothetical protein